MLFVSVYCHVFAFKRVYVCVCVYFCFDPLVCVSPPSGRVCIILPKDTMCLQRGLPHVDNVLGQKNVVFRVSRQTLDFFLHFEKKIKIKQTNVKSVTFRYSLSLSLHFSQTDFLWAIQMIFAHKQWIWWILEVLFIGKTLL